MNGYYRPAVIALTLMLVACGSGPKGSAGFTLPDGDARRGQSTYVELQCQTCHTIEAVPQRPVGGSLVISVPLGGPSSRIQTYGELVTSIINPSHRISQRWLSGVTDEQGSSLMINYNEVITVSQLIDLVAFIQSSYELLPFDYSVYPPYTISAHGPATDQTEH